jgi:hypothetical protein
LSTALSDSDEIRRKMAQIRRDLHADVREVVAGAGAVTDWRRYVRSYPLATVAVVAAAGYLVVPRKSRSLPHDAARQSDVAEVRDELRQAREATPEIKEKTRQSLVGAAVAMAAPLAWRFAKNYALAYLEQWIAERQQQAIAHPGPRPGARQEPGPSAAPGWPGGPAGPRNR